jgi:hypothetical protein
MIHGIANNQHFLCAKVMFNPCEEVVLALQPTKILDAAESARSTEF